MDNLRERYGGILSESIIANVYADNPNEAIQVLEELSNQNPGIPEISKERMINDFHLQFKVLE